MNHSDIIFAPIVDVKSLDTAVQMAGFCGIKNKINIHFKDLKWFSVFKCHFFVIVACYCNTCVAHTNGDKFHVCVLHTRSKKMILIL